MRRKYTPPIYPKFKTEKAFQNWLIKTLIVKGYRVRDEHIVGRLKERIDILTEKHLIECKHNLETPIACYAAIGQLMTYRRHFVSHQLVLAADKISKDNLERLAQHPDIKVWHLEYSARRFCEGIVCSSSFIAKTIPPINLDRRVGWKNDIEHVTIPSAFDRAGRDIDNTTVSIHHRNHSDYKSGYYNSYSVSIDGSPITKTFQKLVIDAALDLDVDTVSGYTAVGNTFDDHYSNKRDKRLNIKTTEDFRTILLSGYDSGKYAGGSSLLKCKTKNSFSFGSLEQCITFTNKIVAYL